MQTYIILANLTQQGITQIKESPARIDAGKEALEAAGGKLLGWYSTNPGYGKGL